VIKVGFVLVLAVLCLAGCKDGAGPAVQEPVKISLSRSACFGFCPIYQVTLSDNGSVVYEGTRFVVVKGKKEYGVPMEEVAALAAKFDAANFFSLKDEYRAQITDNPTYTVTFTRGDKTKTVVDYLGTNVGMPQSVRELEDEIDRVAKTAPLVKNPDGSPVRETD
jgi:hypothetical protein